MLPSDLSAVFQWWLLLFILGAVFLPLTSFIFDRFFDKGYILSKLIGLSISSYVIFLLGLLHIIPFSRFSAILVSLLIGGLTYYLLPKKWKFIYNLRHHYRTFIFQEIFFLLALTAWAYVHSFSPDIHGLEKYMDYGFINSVIRSDYFPPKDMWFTPLYINYYYFGHFMTAVLTKMSGLPSNLTFNIMLSTIFAFCFTQSFSIGANLYTLLVKDQRINVVKRFISGFLTSLLVSLAGNLHVIYGFFKQYSVDDPLPIWKLPFLPLTFPNSYWYPNATRYIYHTIHEFPIYSWVVADLHGHVLDIPFVLLMISLLLLIFLKYDTSQKAEEEAKEETVTVMEKISGRLSNFFVLFGINPLLLILLGFLLAIMYMTNAWDGPIYLILTSFVLLNLYLQRRNIYKKEFEKEEVLKVIPSAKKRRKFSDLIKPWMVALGRDFLFSMLFIGFSFILFTIPYNAFFKPFVSGIGVLCAPDFLTKIGRIGPFLFEAEHCQHSYWWELLMLYGFFYFFVLSFFYYIFKAKKITVPDAFVLLLMLLSTILIILPEFIYVKDIYPAHYRANTMFKFVFQSFIMLSIGSAYTIMRILWQSERDLLRVFRVIFFPITIVLFSLVMTYPYLAINSYYGELKNYQGLDGTAYLRRLYPTDYEALSWLNEKVKGQPVILEAQGDSYTDYARVSANTGLPTVLGWTVHEWLWRGSYDVPAPRINEIKDMYESRDLKQTTDLLTKHNVKYVFVGALEFQKYPALNESKFSQLGKVVFSNKGTRIYEVNR